MIEPDNRELSIIRQCELLGLSRSSYYYEPIAESAENLHYMRMMDEQYIKKPFLGVPRMHQFLLAKGYKVNIKRVERLYKKMGLKCIYPKPRLSRSISNHHKYPYLLRDLCITCPNQVWSTDITYVPMQKGYLYLIAVMDWFSRYVLSWQLSNSMDVNFCLSALEEALEYGKPEIFNTDQGSQFTSEQFTGMLLSNDIKISMDGKGRAIDNVFVERLWRSVKYEELYLHSYETGEEVYRGLKQYFEFYNHERQHQSLNYKTPVSIWKSGVI